MKRSDTSWKAVVCCFCLIPAPVHLQQTDTVGFDTYGKPIGYFDVRDKQDQWIRIALNKGDMIVLPEGIYHRFTLDQVNYVKVTYTSTTVQLLQYLAYCWCVGGRFTAVFAACSSTCHDAFHTASGDVTSAMQAMRLFVGEPVWTPFNRPQDDKPSRKKYVETFLTAPEA